MNAYNDRQANQQDKPCCPCSGKDSKGKAEAPTRNLQSLALKARPGFQQDEGKAPEPKPELVMPKPGFLNRIVAWISTR